MTPTLPENAQHPRLQWYKRGTTDITLTEALYDAIYVEVLDNTIVDADVYYHLHTDTLLVVVDETVRTVLKRNGTPLRCSHGYCFEDCPECAPSRYGPDVPHTNAATPDRIVLATQS